MDETDRGKEATGNSVVHFRARSAVRVSEPLLCDEERLALRRLIGLEKRLTAALVKVEHLEGVCPTFKREITALLRGE